VDFNSIFILVLTLKDRLDSYNQFVVTMLSRFVKYLLKSGMVW
jgi:hypothetical protein